MDSRNSDYCSNDEPAKDHCKVNATNSANEKPFKQTSKLKKQPSKIVLKDKYSSEEIQISQRYYILQ